MQDIDSVNPVEISDAVLELKQRDVVHRHPEGLVRAQDLHLEQSRDTTEAFPPSRECKSARHAVQLTNFIKLLIKLEQPKKKEAKEMYNQT